MSQAATSALVCERMTRISRPTMEGDFPRNLADPYELVCLDIMMPGTSGHEALQGIRQLEAEHGIYGYDGVKVIMTTALKDSKHCVQAFREGCESHVTKPIDPAELLARMQQLGLLSSEAATCGNA